MASPWIGTRLRRSGNRWWDPKPQGDPDGEIVDPRSEWSKTVENLAPVLWWKADLDSGYAPVGNESQFWRDATGHGYDSGSFTGSVSRRPPLIPSAAFDEYSNVIEDTIVIQRSEYDANLFGPSGSLAMVFKRTGGNLAASDFIVRRYDNKIYVMCNPNVDGGSLRFSGGGPALVPFNSYNNDLPHILVLTWGPDGSEFWWNGQRLATGGAPGAATSGFQWEFDAGGHGNFTTVTHDDIVMWNRKLTGAEVVKLHRAYLAGRPARPSWDLRIEETEPVLWWRMDNELTLSGQVALLDRSGNGHVSDWIPGGFTKHEPLIPSTGNGHSFAASNLAAAGPGFAGERPKITKNPQGATHGLALGDSPLLHGASGTVLMVVKASSPTDQSIYLTENSNTLILRNEPVASGQLPTRKLEFLGQTVLSPEEYADEKTHVVSVTWDTAANQAKLYWDWTLKATRPMWSRPQAPVAWGFEWGETAGRVYDDILLWDRVLTDVERSGLQAAFGSPPEEPYPTIGSVVAWWDGASEQQALLDGWWDGNSIQPARVEGWWDGTSIQPLS